MRGHEPIAIIGIGCRLPGGANSAQAFWQLLREAYAHIEHPVPTCLERDFNIPDLPTLTQEVAQITRLQQAAFGEQATPQRRVA